MVGARGRCKPCWTCFTFELMVRRCRFTLALTHTHTESLMPETSTDAGLEQSAGTGASHMSGTEKPATGITGPVMRSSGALEESVRYTHTPTRWATFEERKTNLRACTRNPARFLAELDYRALIYVMTSVYQVVQVVQGRCWIRSRGVILLCRASKRASGRAGRRRRRKRAPSAEEGDRRASRRAGRQLLPRGSKLQRAGGFSF